MPSCSTCSDTGTWQEGRDALDGCPCPDCGKRARVATKDVDAAHQSVKRSKSEWLNDRERDSVVKPWRG